jgi:hypothetical protein
MASILKVNTIQDATNSNTAISVDSSGRVTRSVIPSWRLGLTSGLSISTADLSDVVFTNTSTNNCFLNGGCTHSSGVITVPVTGLYQINACIRLDSVSANYIELYIRVNSSTSTKHSGYHIEGDPYSNYHSISSVELFSLSANDNVRCSIYAGGDSSYTMNQASNFSGFLVG